MAFGNNTANKGTFQPRGNYRGGSTGAAKTEQRTKRNVVYSTGLFTPKSEKSKAIGSIMVAEDVMIPAGTWLNLYVFDGEVKEGKQAPAYRLVASEGTAK